MSFGEVVARSFFGSTEPPRSTFGALGWRGSEIVVGGYRRGEIVKGTWEIDGNVATAVVRFGPFRSSVQVDSGLLIVEDSVVELPFDGDVRLLPGMEFEHRFEVTVGG